MLKIAAVATVLSIGTAAAAPVDRATADSARSGFSILPINVGILNFFFETSSSEEKKDAQSVKKAASCDDGSNDTPTDVKALEQAIPMSGPEPIYFGF